MSKIESIVVLTGAGISAESGLRTFRDSGGLWEGHSVEEVATPEAFAANPQLVLEFYNQRRRQLKDVKPNAAHEALSNFEKQYEGKFLLVTQNVDDLHERAGSKNIRHMHGQLREVRCTDSGDVFAWENDITLETAHPNDPTKRGCLRPHIVWFGEIPLYMEEIYQALSQCDLFISIGTSGNVYPAAGFVGATPKWCRRVEINREASVVNSAFSESKLGLATKMVPQFFDELLKSTL